MSDSGQYDSRGYLKVRLTNDEQGNHLDKYASVANDKGIVEMTFDDNWADSCYATRNGECTGGESLPLLRELVDEVPLDPEVKPVVFQIIDRMLDRQ